MSSEAKKFINSLDEKRIALGSDTSKVLEYLINKGITKSFEMKRGAGELRHHIYTFSDGSKINLISKPKGINEGLELVELRIVWGIEKNEDVN